MKSPVWAATVLVSSLWFLFAPSARAYTINTTELGKRIRWAEDSVGLQVSPGYHGFLGPGQAYDALEISLDAWRGLPRVPELIITKGKPPAPGYRGEAPNNGVYVLSRWPYEAEKLAVTVVTYDMETGRLLDADVLVNGGARFDLYGAEHDSRRARERYDLAAVLTHEAGHVLGLGETAADQTATMWPYAVPGETQKRTLTQDDEDGAIESYLGAPPGAARGCGALSVMGRTRTPLWLPAAVLVLLGARRRTRLLPRALPALIMLCIVGWGEPERPIASRQARLLRLQALTPADADAGETLRAAARDADGELRLHAALALERAGRREERGLAEQLCGDGEEVVAAQAHVALSELLARAPRATLPATDPRARARLADLVTPGSTLHNGVSRVVGTRLRDGAIMTRVAVTAPDGRAQTLEVLGGVHAGIGQRALHLEPPPADGKSIVVAQQRDGSQRWAYASGSLVFGGYLGEGPAIDTTR